MLHPVKHRRITSTYCVSTVVCDSFHQVPQAAWELSRFSCERRFDQLGFFSCIDYSHHVSCWVSREVVATIQPKEWRFRFLCSRYHVCAYVRYAFSHCERSCEAVRIVLMYHTMFWCITPCFAGFMWDRGRHAVVAVSMFFYAPAMFVPL